jgi:autotransporter translocation and assembly factor TamB
MLEIENLRGELHLTRVFERELHLRLLQVSGMTFRVQDYGGGQIDLPRRLGGPSSEPSRARNAALALAADRIVFEEARFVYNNWNIPWRLDAEGVSANLELDGANRHRGAITYQHGTLQIKDRRPIESSVDVRLELVGRELLIEELVAGGRFYELIANGKVSLEEEPRAELAIEIESEVGPAARSLLGLELLESDGRERARMEGTLSMGRGWHLLQGQARVPRARFAGMPLWGFEGEISWDRNLFEVRSANGYLANGATTLSFRQPIPIAGQSAELAVGFEEVLLSRLMESVDGDVRRLGSRISGRADLAFRLSSPSNVNGDFELTGVAPPDSEDDADLLGLDFSATGVFEDGTLKLNPSQIETDAVVAKLDGAYPPVGPAALSFEARARDLAEADQLQQTVRLFANPDSPVSLLGVAGSGRAKGQLTGRLPHLVFRGSFAGEQIVYQGLRLGEVEADGNLSSEAIELASLRAEVDGAKLNLKGELALGPGSLLSRDFRIELELARWQTSDLQTVLGLPIGLKGLLSGRGNFSSRAGHLSGRSTASVESGSLQGQRFDTASARVRLQGQTVLLSPLSVTRGPAKVEGELELDVVTHDIQGELHATRAPIAGLLSLPWEADGALDGDLTIGGSFEEPDLELDARVSGLNIAGTELGEAKVQAHLKENTLDGTVSAQGPELQLDTSLRTGLSPGMPIHGRARWRGAELGPLLRSVRNDLPASLRVRTNGEASFGGTLGSIETLSAEATLSALTLEIPEYHLASPSPVELRLRDGTLEIQRLRLAGEDTELGLKGRLNVAKKSLELDAAGSVNLQVLESFFRSTSWAGQAEVAAQLSGAWEHPSLSGYVDLSGGTLSFQTFPQAIGDIHGRVLFDNRTVRFERIESLFGGAPVTISGNVSLEGLSPDAFEVRATGSELRLRYPEGLLASVDADLSLTGTPKRQVLAGRIEVREATWTREYDVAAGILGSKDVIELVDGSEAGAVFPDLRLDVSVVAPDSLRVRNSMATIDARAEFQLRGTLARPALLGQFEALGGEVFLLGQKYNVVSGKVEFVDPNAIKPFFDLTAETRVRSYRVELRLTGTPDRFFPELSSDPPLRSIEILRLLAGATERDLRVGSEEEEIAGVGVAGLLTERLNQQLTQRAGRLFGLDRFSIDPFLVGKFANPTARLSVGKQISRDVAINYSTKFGETTESIVVVIEYTPKGPVTWIFSRDETGALGVDMKFRKSF